jgi:hypothetical protein
MGPFLPVSHAEMCDAKATASATLILLGFLPLASHISLLFPIKREKKKKKKEGEKQGFMKVGRCNGGRFGTLGHLVTVE